MTDEIRLDSDTWFSPDLLNALTQRRAGSPENPDGHWSERQLVIRNEASHFLQALATEAQGRLDQWPWKRDFLATSSTYSSC